MGRNRGSRRSRFRVGRLALLACFALGAAALLERYQEARDVERYASHETYADIGHARVRYRMLGMGQPGPTVVFLNGISACLEQWDPAQTAVARTAPTLSYDLAGTGLSSGASAHDAQAESDELAALLSALHVQGRVIVVGYSATGSLARVFAARHPDSVAGTVLLVPYLPEMDVKYPERYGELATLSRSLITSTVQTLFGLQRLRVRLGLAHLSGPASTELALRSLAIFVRFPHWWAVDRQVLAAKESARQAMASHSSEPLMVIRSTFNDVPHYPEAVDEFAAAHHAELRLLDGIPHSNILEDPRSIAGIAEDVAELVQRARARPQ